GFCIPLLRSDCHPGTPAAVVAGRAHRVLLSRRAWRVPNYPKGVAAAHERLPRLGRCLCRQPQDPRGKGQERGKQGGTRTAVLGTHGTREPVRCLLHLQKHGAGAVFQIRPTQVSDRGSELPHYPSRPDRKSTRLNSSHVAISYAVFCLKKKKKKK